MTKRCIAMRTPDAPRKRERTVLGRITRAPTGGRTPDQHLSASTAADPSRPCGATRDFALTFAALPRGAPAKGGRNEPYWSCRLSRRRWFRLPICGEKSKSGEAGEALPRLPGNQAQGLGSEIFRQEAGGGMRAPWPTREEFLAWGLRPCEGSDCRKLVNPLGYFGRDRAPAAMCSACRRAWLDRFWARQRETGAAGGGNQDRRRGR